MHKADNLPPSCAVVTKSGNLNFLEPFGALRACNGTALPLPFTYSLTLRLIRVLIVALEKQQVLHILSVFSYP